MTDDKISKVLINYQIELTWLRTSNRASSEGEIWCRRVDHLLTMIPKMREMLDSLFEPTTSSDRDYVYPKREKLMRWLGFMQGVMWTLGIYTIDEMRSHNMPDDEKVADDGQQADR